MKIFNWNCNGDFKKKFKCISDEKFEHTYVDADIYVIQECEDPEKKVDKKRKEYKEFQEYKEWADKHNYFWIGNEDKNKGLGIFAKEDILAVKGKWADDLKYFILLRVKDSFNLLCVWAMPEYVEMIHDFFDANEDLFDEDLIICGDFNSNVVFNDKHTYVRTHKDKDGYDKHHTNLDWKLNQKGLYSVYHKLSRECNGEETRYTFFQGRHLNVPFHLDYFYAHEKIINKTELMNFWKRTRNEYLPHKFDILDYGGWVQNSDHLPLVLNLRKKIDFENEYALHRLTQENLELFDLEFVASERQFKDEQASEDETIRVDNIAFDGKDLVIIEYKNVEYDDESDLKVVKQAEDYEKIVKKYPQEFNYCLSDGKVFPFENTRVMIIGPKFTKSQLANSPKNFEFWKVSLYDTCNNKCDVEYKNMKTGKIRMLNIDLDELDNLYEEKTLKEAKITEENSVLYKEFRKQVKENFNDVRLVFFDRGVSFKLNKKTVCQVRLGKNVRVQYNTDFDSRYERINDISGTTYLGNCELTLNSKEDIEYACEFFEQVYNEKKEE